MNAGMFKLQVSDFAKGAVMAVLAGILVAIAGVAQAPGFDLFTLDWGSLVHTVINVAFVAFAAYIAKNFVSDQNGAVLGVVGGSK